MSKFQSDYDSLKASVASLKPAFNSINDEIDKLLGSKSNDEITAHSISATTSIDKAHTIIDDCSDRFALINNKIEKMDGENEEQEKEQQKQTEMLNSTDGSSNMPMDPVSLSSLLTKIEKRYSRVFETVSSRVGIQSRHFASALTSAGPPLPPTASSLDSSATLSHQPNLVLPPIKLECFDGTDITKWPAYKYQLDMLILEQPHLNEVEKAVYVRSSLRGTALSLVSSIPTTKNFLEKMIDRLTQEYGRKSLTQAIMLLSLFQIRSKSNTLDDQISAVRSMINIVNTIDTDCGLDW